VGSDDVAEEGAVVALLEAIMPALLLVRPADGQIACRLKLVIDDGPVAHPRPDERVTPALQGFKERV
jgi:hypothetical protein